MIKRIWHGWTTPENADTYENLLKEEIFEGIASKEIVGYQGIQLLRLAKEDEVEFVTIMTFDSIDAVKNFMGEDYTTAYVPDAARKILKRFDAHSQHYEVREERMYR